MITRRRAILSGSSTASLMALGSTLPLLSACQPAATATTSAVATAAASGGGSAVIATVANAVEIAANVVSAFIIGDGLVRKKKSDGVAIELVEAVDESAQAIGEVAEAHLPGPGTASRSTGSRQNPANALVPPQATRPATAQGARQIVVLDHVLLPMSVDGSQLSGRVTFTGIPTLPGRRSPLSAAWVAPVLWGVDQKVVYGTWMSIGADEWGAPMTLPDLAKAFAEVLSNPGLYRQGWAIRDYGEQEEVLGVGSILEMLTDDEWVSETFQARSDVGERAQDVELPSYTVAAGKDEVLSLLYGS